MEEKSCTLLRIWLVQQHNLFTEPDDLKGGFVKTVESVDVVSSTNAPQPLNWGGCGGGRNEAGKVVCFLQGV
jgi:hypothetical protein